jgi:serine/threonine protein kinase/lipoprotein NlpI
VKVGPYAVEGELGRGGAGVVYRARDAGGRAVAIKLLLQAPNADVAKRRFDREVEALRRLDHPGVVGIRDAGRHEGRPYLVMEWVAGESLTHRLERGGPLDAHDAAELVQRLARALEHAHRQGVLHRDVKPDNVLLNAQGGLPLLIDFGLTADLAASRHSLTQEGTFFGTPGFFPPEQVTGELTDVGPRSDVYGLGATLYACLTGRAPFVADTLADLLTLTVKASPTPPSRLRAGVDPALESICLRCLAKSPADRLPSAGALAEALDGYLAGESTATRPAGLRLALGLLLVGLLVAGLVVASAPPGVPAVTTSPTLASAASSPTKPPPPPPDDSPAKPDYLTLARQARRQGKPEAALSVIRFGLADDPADPVPLLQERGFCLADLQRWEEAQEPFEQILELHPDDPDAWFNRGMMRRALGEMAASRADFERAVELSPEPGAPLLLARGMARLTTGDFTGALSDLERAVTKDPDDMEARRYRGVAHMMCDAPEAALRDFEVVAEHIKERDLPEFLNNWAVCLSRCERWEESVALYGRLLERRDHAGTRLARAADLIYLGRANAALEDVDRALELGGLEPRKLASTLGLRGRLRWQAGEREEGLADLRESQRLRPTPDNAIWIGVLANEPQALAPFFDRLPPWRQALARWLTGQLDDAELLANTDIPYDPAEPQGALCEAHGYLGARAEVEGDRPRAIEHYRACLATGLTPYVEYLWSRQALDRLE